MEELRAFDFVYYVWSETLVGDISGKSFCVRAFSGGGRGRMSGEAETSFASFSPHRGTDDARGVRGGTLPPGLWRVKVLENYAGRLGKPVARLTPMSYQVADYPTREYAHRPFLIHGRGEQGSDGCIVIARPERVPLLDAIGKAGGATVLVTLSTRPGDLFDRAMERGRTA
jgi:hypothetical protein